MADGSVKIDIVADNSDVEEKLKDSEEGFEELGKKQKENQKETEKTTDKYKELTETIDEQEKKLAELKGEYTKAIVNFGKGSAEAEQLAGEIKELNDELKKNKKAFGDASDEADKLTGSLDDNKGGFDIVNIAAGNLVAGGLTALVGKAVEVVGTLMSLSEETREYREDMAKLDAAFVSNKKSTESARKAYDTLYKIIGESDQTVEAAQQISLLAKSEAEVVKWSQLAAGVVGKFGDALQPETFYESANETLKLGEATGAYTQMLEGTGYSVEKFNQGLAKLTTQAEKEQYMLEVTQSILGDTAAEYNSLTKSTQEARDATNRMEQAQAKLGEAVEPLTTWWTDAKASMMSWAAEGVSGAVNGITNLKTNIDVLTESQRELVDGVSARTQAYKDAKTAAAELAAAQMADVDYATSTLLPQLQALVDANGNVKAGYEERAAFIMGQLNEAFGTEYTRISEIIGANGQLTESIQQTILAKQAEILLAEKLAGFEEATKNIEAEKKARDELLNQIAAQTQAVEEAEKEKQRVYAETEEAFRSGVESQVRQAMIKRGKVDGLLNEEKTQLSKLGAAYNESDELIATYNKNIEEYTTGLDLVMKGKTADAVSYLNSLGGAYEETESQAQKSAEEQKKALEERLTNAVIKLGLLTEEFKTNESSMTEAQKAEMKKRIAAAQKEADDLGEEAKKVGSNLVEGIGVGADGKKDWLSGKFAGIVSSAIEAGKKAGIIKSPSRKTRDEVGIPLVQGIVVGMEKEAPKLEKSAKTIIDDLTELVKNEAEKSKVTAAKLNEEYRQEVEEHNKALEKLETDNKKTLADLEEKLIEDKKKKGADKAKLDKEYAKQVESINARHHEAVEKENTAHASRLEKIEDDIRKTVTSKASELVQHGETYKNAVKKLWEDLDNSISSLQKNYDNQLASRTESIANSLNLWSKAEKNKVSGNELKRNLKSQVDMLEDFNQAISKLEERGVSESFVNALKNMGVGATGEIEALAKMSDKALEAYISLWEEKNALAAEAATEELEPLKAEREQKIQELTSAAVAEYEKMREQFKIEGEKLAEELKQAMIDSGDAGYEEIINQVSDYTSAGADLMDGVVAGVITESPALEKAVRKAVQRAIDAAKEEAGIASPSKVMKKEVGHNLAEGLIVGWADRMAEIRRGMAADMRGLTSQLKTAVVLDNARTSQTVGSRDTGLADVARAVGIQTAGINSLAGEYRKGTSTTRPVILQLNGRELGRAVVDLGGTEETRVGVKLSHGGVY